MKYLSAQEQQQLLKKVRYTKGSERDYVAMALILNTGLRARELCGVTVGDIRNKSRLYVRPEDGKRGRGRFVTMNVFIQDTLRKWLAHKMAMLQESIEDDAPLFVTRLKKPLRKRSLQHLVEKWVIASGLTTTRDGVAVALFSVHSLRHTYAKRLQERGVAITTIQKLLGHASLASTGVYTEASDAELEAAAHALTIGAARAEQLSEAL